MYSCKHFAFHVLENLICFYIGILRKFQLLLLFCELNKLHSTESSDRCLYATLFQSLLEGPIMYVDHNRDQHLKHGPFFTQGAQSVKHPTPDFWLRSSSQGHGIEPCAGLHAQQGVDSLPLPLLLPLHMLTLSI